MTPVRTCALVLVATLAAACGETPAPSPAAGTGGGEVPAAPAKEGPATAPETDLVVQTYDRGLDFLLGLQKDGVWEGSPGTPSPEMTAMAVAALYERPGGIRPKDAETGRKAIEFLLSKVDADGMIAGTQTPNYAISVAVMALAASGRADAKPAIQRCVAKLRTFQFLDRDNSTYGGLGYGSDHTRSDLSNTQFALASLRAAGVSADDKVYKDALEFLTRTQNRKENETAGEPERWPDPKDPKIVYVRSNDGGANYRPGDSKAGYEERPDGTRVLRSYGSMTYALLRCYHLAGLPATDGRVKAAVDWIQRNWMLEHNPGMPATPKDQRDDGLYYMYATMGKTLPVAGIDTIEHGGAKIDWRKALSEHLAKAQKPDGSWLNAGSPRWDEGNPVVATAFALTALSACKK